MKVKEFKESLKRAINDEEEILINDWKLSKNAAKNLLYGFISVVYNNKHYKINYKNFFDNIDLVLKHKDKFMI